MDKTSKEAHFRTIGDLMDTNQHRKTHVHRSAFAAIMTIALVISTSGGCSMMGDGQSGWPWKKKPDEKEIALARPAKLVSIWSESVVYGANKQPTRGLGGRIYFYNQNHKVVPADGELVVYAFDDEATEDKDVPRKKYVFSAEQFASHFSESEFGPSYSIWIPWDRVGGKQQAVSLMPIFKSADGQVLVGDHSRNLLKGKKNKEADSETELADKDDDDDSSIQQASFSESEIQRLKESTTGASQRSLRTSTIEIPASMRKRIMSRRNYVEEHNRARYDRRSNALNRRGIPSPDPARLLSVDQQRPKSLARAAQVGQPIRGLQRLPRYRATSPFDRSSPPQSHQGGTAQEYSGAFEHSSEPHSETRMESGNQHSTWSGY